MTWKALIQSAADRPCNSSSGVDTNLLTPAMYDGRLNTSCPCRDSMYRNDMSNLRHDDDEHDIGV